MPVWALLKPNICVLGYGLFLAVNAAGVWGGVLPFIPTELQTPELMLYFAAAQAIVFCVSYWASAAGVYYFPGPTRRFLVPLAAIPYFCGWALIVVALYLEDATARTALMTTAGALLGLGSAGFYMLWQRIFAGMPQERGAHDLMVGTIYAAPLYFALHLIPNALTALLIPLVFLPMFGLCIVLAGRTVQRDQPLFDDIPRDHPHAYCNVMRASLPSALAVGAVGLCAGTVRSLAITEPATGVVVNIVAMAASMVAAVVVLLLWRQRDLVINTPTIFRTLFPFIVTAFALLALLGRPTLPFFGGLMNAFYSGAVVLMMLQCMQVSRDDGINPVFVYGFFGGVVYTLHDIGFLSAGILVDVHAFGLAPHLAACIVALWLLAIIFFMITGGFKPLLGTARKPQPIELLSLNANPRARTAAARRATSQSEPGTKQDPTTPTQESISAAAPQHSATPGVRDRLSKQCLALQATYHLSTRETEVVELLARGNSAAGVAKQLVVSENTIKTHMQRIYAKLDIHKKQELLSLIQSFSPSDL